VQLPGDLQDKVTVEPGSVQVNVTVVTSGLSNIWQWLPNYRVILLKDTL